MCEMANTSVPRLVILEGVDGSGKTALFHALSKYYEQIFSNVPLYTDSFPGTHPKTLGEWVYRFHRNQVTRAPSSTRVAPPALQLLHIAAHVDTIVAQIEPTLKAGGNVLLDRYWWSAYAYSRTTLSADQARRLVAVERMFWEPLPSPVIIYLRRQRSLKPYQVTQQASQELDGYYQELITEQRAEGIEIHEIDNNGTLEAVWRTLLEVLNLPPIPYDMD